MRLLIFLILKILEIAVILSVFYGLGFLKKKIKKQPTCDKEDVILEGAVIVIAIYVVFSAICGAYWLWCSNWQLAGRLT